MIGIFDSGYGGLPTMRAVTHLMPELDVIYLGDHARAPYGPRSPEEIYQFALEGVEYLFAKGCEIVVFACNTAAANALRRIQQDVLPKKYPGKKVLGILVPTVEQITGVTWSGGEHAAASALVDDHASIGILATEATIKSGAYEREILKRRPDLLVIGQACSDLSPMIEAGAKTDALRPVVKTYLADLYAKQKEGTPPISVVLLGCTHYELIADLISQELPKGVKLLGQSAIVAQALLDYLARHPEIDERLTKGGSRTFLTTGDAAEVSRLGSTFFGQGIQFETVHL